MCSLCLLLSLEAVLSDFGPRGTSESCRNAKLSEGHLQSQLQKLLAAVSYYNSVDTCRNSSAAKWEMYWGYSETEAKSVVFLRRQKDISLSALNTIPLLR